MVRDKTIFTKEEALEQYNAFNKKYGENFRWSYGVRGKVKKDLERAYPALVFSIVGSGDSVKANVIGAKIKKEVKENKEQTVDISIHEINGIQTVLAKIGSKKIGGVRLKPYKDGYQVDTVLVYPEYKGLGIAKEMYRLANEELGPIYSDQNQTVEAEKLWNSLIKTGEAKKENGLFKMIK